MKINLANGKNQTLPWVNVLKGIAILMVLIVHSTQRFELPFILNEACKFGQMGCQIFFVISAFCIYMSYERHKESIGGFYKRRFITVAPGYWLTIIFNIAAVLLIVYIYGYSRRAQYFTVENVSANFLLLNGLCIGKANNYIVRGGWYIGTTVILYFLFPFLVCFYKRYAQRIKCLFPFLIFAFVLAVLFVAGMFSSTLYCKNYSFVYYSFFNQLPCYSLGIVLYDLYKNDDLERIKNPLMWALLSFVASLIFFYGEIPYSFVFEPFVFGLTAFFFICWLMRKPYQYNSKISVLLQEGGANSFSIYLIHSFIVFDAARFLTKYVPDNWIVWLIWFPLACILILWLSIPYEKLINLLQKGMKKLINN